MSFAFALSMAFLHTPYVEADTVFGFYAGGGVWSQDVEGSAASLGQSNGLLDQSTNTLDLEDDLGFAKQDNVFLYVGLEHGISVLPNVRIDYSELTQSADGQLDRSLNFNGQTFDFSTNLRSEVDLEQTDILLYYQLLDSVLELDIGLGVRHVDGFVSVVDEEGSSAAEFRGVIPIVYAGGRIDLPLTGLWLSAQARGLAYKGDQLVDADARIGWESELGLGLELGYRVMDLELDEFDDIDSADLSFAGPFAGLNYRF